MKAPLVNLAQLLETIASKLRKIAGEPKPQKPQNYIPVGIVRLTDSRQGYTVRFTDTRWRKR